VANRLIVPYFQTSDLEGRYINSALGNKLHEVSIMNMEEILDLFGRSQAGKVGGTSVLCFCGTRSGSKPWDGGLFDARFKTSHEDQP
jgi:hypothetical protein